MRDRFRADVRGGGARHRHERRGHVLRRRPDDAQQRRPRRAVPGQHGRLRHRGPGRRPQRRIDRHGQRQLGRADHPPGPRDRARGHARALDPVPRRGRDAARRRGDAAGRDARRPDRRRAVQRPGARGRGMGGVPSDAGRLCRGEMRVRRAPSSRSYERRAGSTEPAATVRTIGRGASCWTTVRTGGAPSETDSIRAAIDAAAVSGGTRGRAPARPTPLRPSTGRLRLAPTTAGTRTSRPTAISTCPRTSARPPS